MATKWKKPRKKTFPSDWFGVAVWDSEPPSKSGVLMLWHNRGELVLFGAVVDLMKIQTAYKAFEWHLDQIAPVYDETTGLLDNPKYWDEPS